MATKKCPKCGEENPAEAVMCWACYTPLAGGAAAAAGGGLVTPRGGAASVTPAAAAAAQEEEKTSVDPKLFLVVGLLVVAAVIGSFTTGLIGGGGGDDDGLPEVTSAPGGSESGGGNSFIPPPQQPQAPVNPPTFNPPTTPGGTGGGGTTGPAPPQSKVVVPPDPRQSIGTMGIILSQPNVSPNQALALAKFAKQQFAPGGRWKGMQVVVFSDPAAAKIFLKYQALRKGAPLTPVEYQDLSNQGLWNSVPVYYETQGKAEYPYLPSANPKNWWSGRRR